MDTRYPVSMITIMGDSLSDCGTMYDMYLFGIFPMRYPSDLAGKSPRGRFTNGWTWVDHFSAIIANQNTIKILKEEGRLLPDEISDAVICSENRYQSLIKESYSLKNDKNVKYLGKEFVENYSEGGLTSFNYECMPSCNIARFFKRNILTNLDTMREKLLADDKKQRTTREEKQKTLIIEWSGANDLITVNREPSKLEVDRAIASRLKNIEVLIAAGYQHFILFNLPDLSLTPRFQALSQSKRDKAHRVSMYFNQQLAIRVKQLQASHPVLTLSIFDVCSELTKIFNDPAAVGLDPAKKTKPYLDSDDFRLHRNKTSPAEGYLFWDDVHPTADVHAGLATFFYEKCLKQYAIKPRYPASVSIDFSERGRRNSMG